MQLQTLQHVKKTPPNWGVYLLLTFATFFWGGQFNAAKIAVQYLPPLTTAAARFLVASVLIFGITLLTEGNIVAMVRRNLLIYVLLGLIGVVGFNALFFFGIRLTSPTNGALIVATNPLLTALISSLVLRERIGRHHRIGTMLSFAGVAALVLTGTRGSVVRINLGDLFVIGAVICFALYAVLGRKYLRDSTPIMTTAATMIIGAPILWLVARGFDGDVSFMGLPWQAFAAIAFMGVFGSVLAYILWNFGISHIGVNDTAVFFHLVPVFTVMLSFALGQVVTLKQIAAGVVVITGVLISTGAIARIRQRSVALQAPAEVAPE
jgi:drug/metabolite transporter (DMT)-like permease